MDTYAWVHSKSNSIAVCHQLLQFFTSLLGKLICSCDQLHFTGHWVCMATSWTLAQSLLCPAAVHQAAG